jgi:ADP-ribosylglycohydrolase
MLQISSDIHSSKIHGCWLGKAVGGTLGTPHEGKTGPLALSFYDPVPTTSLPNDDLDLQVVWLHHLRQTKARAVTPEILAEAWQTHVLFPFDEYAVARRNRAWKLRGPLQGATDNFFGECMGAAIRSEIWACLAPGDPTRAAGFAWADAVVDHSGDGVWAEIFHAAIEAAAFVESDRDKLIQIGLSYLPTHSRLRQALVDTINWWRAHREWRTVRGLVIARYYNGNFTDVVCNLCFELIGWFDGDGDFARSICTAVNCGLDTDCTGATLGALLGIIDPGCIPAAWRKPIGEDVVLSDAIVGLTKPKDLGELTRWTIEVARQLADYNPEPGIVLPRRPADAINGIHPIIAEETFSSDAALLTAAEAPCPSKWQPATLHGFWSNWTAKDFQERVRIIRVKFQLTAPCRAKLMLFYKPRATAWLDGRHIITVTQEAIEADSFIAPSFHRAGVTAVTLPLLESGHHELIMAFESPPSGKATDLIFGLADAETNLWLPDAFVLPHPALS